MSAPSMAQTTPTALVGIELTLVQLSSERPERVVTADFGQVVLLFPRIGHWEQGRGQVVGGIRVWR